MLALVVLAPLLITDVPSPRDHGGWVSDVADVIDAPVETRLDATIDAFHRASGVEIAVVTVGDVVGEPHAWGTDLFNAWGIGKAGSDNGVLLLLVMDRRSVETVTGDGIRAALPDDWLQQMQGDAMVPAFKRGDYGAGIEAAVVGIIEHLQTTGESGAERTTPSTSAPGQPPVTATDQPASQPRRDTAPWVPIGVGGGALGLGTAAYLIRRRRQRICSACHVGMLKLDEIADDAHLDEGQRKEEQVGSVDYEVRVCPGCQITRTFTHTRLFSRYRRCDKCAKRTARSRSETIVAATYSHGGQIRITTDCAHCGHSSQRIRHTAQRSRPSTSTASSSSSRSSYSSPSSSSRSSSSSSSSRSSSFGGGRSSGGGSSSKW